ncbi:unnamed protein product [Rhodiola kirilowii]
MRMFSWNCRGLGRPRTVRALKDAVRVFSPQIVCLMETKKKAVDGDWIRLKLGFRNCFAVDCRGRAGGLALLWDDSIQVSIVNYSSNHIDAVVEDSCVFRLTLFYGEPKVSDRILGWNLLRRLCGDRDIPWVVIGDFNEVISSSEVYGSRGRQNWQMENFRRALEECGLSDLGFSGYPFTFSNRREGEAEVRARLDRAVASVEWRRAFPRASVRHVQLHVSDQQLIVLDTENRCVMRKKKMFRFEAMWLDHPAFSGFMNEFWNSTEQHNMRWSVRLKRCRERLKAWNSSVFGNVQRRISSLKQELEEIRKAGRSPEMIEKENCISDDLDFWLAREEIMWMQRSRALWMEHVDKNTKFFHAKASHRKKKNWISKLRDSQGNLCEGEELILGIVTGYFGNIYQSSISMNAAEIEAQLEDVNPCITGEMNDMLLGDILEEEIREAVFSLGPLKAPGIDGFPAVFYQKFWNRLKSDIVREVQLFWLDGILDEEINRTLITLIPKKNEADRMEDWRPISLCTVAMKIITKVIASRLQKVLHLVISPFQSAFVKGRNIIDNFVVAHENAHFLRRCRDSGKSYASIKLDMSKAYERVEWPFLEKLMLKMGFAERWVDRVMRCIKSVSYQVRVNGIVSGVIRPGRGLRQGDPLSPYLFLLCTEVLNAKLRLGEIGGQISGVRICRRAPVVTHLFFADDSIFFIKAEAEEARALKGILAQYENVSGQRINLEKSEICFSRNSPAHIRDEVCRVIGVRQVGSHSKYLGLPLIFGQRKTDSFRCIVEKVWRKINDWKSKLLSAAGREVLVKAIIQAMPAYMMSVYQFPKAILVELNKLIQQFWWNKKEGHGISWLSQDLLQKKKWEGGLGFRNLELFNGAMLMRVAWRLVKYPQLLMSRMLLARYCDNLDINHARMGSSPSHIWRGIMRNIGVFLDGIWFDVNGGSYRWKHSSNGEFSVRSAYEVIKLKASNSGNSVGEQSDKSRIHHFWKRVWACRIPNKIKMFCWRFFHDSLPDAKNLYRRGVSLDLQCRVCGFRNESALHVVRDCWWAQALFQEVGLRLPLNLRTIDIPADWIWHSSYFCDEEDFRSLLVVLWLCWKNRNRIWHGEDCWSTRKADFIGKHFLKTQSSWLSADPMVSVASAENWTPPDLDVVKINTDGSWLGMTRSAGVGVVARDHMGTVLWSWAEGCSSCFCSGKVEGKALMKGMLLASRMSIRKAIFEIDSLEVYGAIVGCYGVSEWCESWLQVILDLLRRFPSWSISFKRRESNLAADGLAFRASSQGWIWSRLDAIPLCLVGLV